MHLNESEAFYLIVLASDELDAQLQDKIISKLRTNVATIAEAIVHPGSASQKARACATEIKKYVELTRASRIKLQQAAP